MVLGVDLARHSRVSNVASLARRSPIARWVAAVENADAVTRAYVGALTVRERVGCESDTMPDLTLECVTLLNMVGAESRR